MTEVSKGGIVMDFDAILKDYKAKTCIISVERFADSDYGNIRVVAGNKAHCDDMEALMHRSFVPDTPYEMWFPKDMNFEDFCYRCACLGEPLHTYVSLYQMGLWLNMFLLPLQSDKENTGYCVYTYDVAPIASADKMSDISGETSADVLRTCIKLRSSTNIRETFNDVIKDIGNLCGSDYCCILLTDSEKQSCSLLCEHIKEGTGLLSMNHYIDEGFYDIVETWKDTLSGSTCVIIKDEHDMEKLKEKNTVWYDSLKGAGAKSVVLFPLNHGDELLGYMWAVDFNVEDTVKIKETLELTTFFVAAEISNYQLVKKLEVLSSIDMLTGIKNRNTMNNRVDRIVAGKENLASPYAVIFADLNGLKRVNDEKGHSEGDNLLKSAAAILQEVFHDSEVYRAGGDEFMVIAEGIGEDEVNRRIEKLYEQSASVGDLHFAVGISFGSSREDILKAMRLADEGMYKDKKKFYEINPDVKYR